MSDRVNHPDYYTKHSIEVIDIIKVCIENDPAFRGYLKSNVLKYILV